MTLKYVKMKLENRGETKKLGSNSFNLSELDHYSSRKQNFGA